MFCFDDHVCTVRENACRCFADHSGTVVSRAVTEQNVDPAHLSLSYSILI